LKGFPEVASPRLFHTVTLGGTSTPSTDIVFAATGAADRFRAT
jgi:hypothetical protein